MYPYRDQQLKVDEIGRNHQFVDQAFAVPSNDADSNLQPLLLCAKKKMIDPSLCFTHVICQFQIYSYVKYILCVHIICFTNS